MDDLTCFISNKLAFNYLLYEQSSALYTFIIT